MSSKRAMKQAQKQAYAKHRSNITNSRFEKKNRNSIKNKSFYQEEEKLTFLFKFFYLFTS